MSLTAISSFRPLVDLSEVTRNQLRANRSWRIAFDQIVYFGKKDDRLANSKTSFIDSEEFPHMVLLMKAASWCAGAACIINADIVVSPHLREIVYEAFSRGFEAVTSQRYEFDPATEDYTKAKVVDLGIDFFCALPHVWHEASIRVPNEFRLGHCSWDSWLSSYFNMSLRHRFTSLVKRRCIFHPKHGDRKQPHRIDFKDDYWSARPGFPLPL